jgi:uncharacterized sulfatase
MTHGDPMRGGRHGDEGLKIGRQGLQDVEQFVDRAVLQKKPFYLWYAPMMPHQPHNPPERLLSKYRTKTDSLHVARYWAMCEWFDETVGELLDHLERKGLTRNTLVIYLADNGWIQDSVADRFAPRSKTSPYDGGIRTPILLRRPGTVRSRTAGALAISIDLAPTILQAVGLKPLPLMPGVNLLDDRALRRRKMIFGEIFTHNATDIHKPAANLQYRWVIENNWKLILPAPSIAKNAQAELYDLARDPQEMQDQAVTNQDKIARLARLIENWWPITADATQY